MSVLIALISFIIDTIVSFIDTERVHKMTFTKIAKEFGKEFPDELRRKVLGIQERDCANLIINTLQLDLTVEGFLEKARVMEETEMSNVKLMHGMYLNVIITKLLYCCFQIGINLRDTNSPWGSNITQNVLITQYVRIHILFI